MQKIFIKSFTAHLFLLFSSVNFTSAAPDVLKGLIDDGRTNLSFTWMKVEKLLANEHLPVWVAKYGIGSSTRIRHELKTHEVMKLGIGEFSFYQNIEQTSAILYTEKTQIVNGVIDNRFVIRAMPIKELSAGNIIGSQYIQIIRNNMFHHDYMKPLDLSMLHHHDSSSFAGYSNSSEHDIYESDVTKLYPEILLLVPHASVRKVKKFNPRTYLQNIVEYYLIYFNLIDMMYKKLSTSNIEIDINLAGIVIEHEPIFPFMRYYLEPSQNLVALDAITTLNEIPKYLYSYRDIFPEDSYDFFFLSNNEPLWMAPTNEMIKSLSLEENKFQKRVQLQKLTNVLGSVIQLQGIENYNTAVYEIAHLLTIPDDSVVGSESDYREECSNLMQSIFPSCRFCLNWSNLSYQKLKKYINDDPNHCYLLNYPRSLYPHGTKMLTLTPSEQCRCFGYKYYQSLDGTDNVPPFECGSKLVCHTETKVRSLGFVFNGTSCGLRKVCWDSQCQALE